MKISHHRFNNHIVSIYFLDKEEKIARHKHNYEHSTGVSQGRSKVEIEGQEIFEMFKGMSDCILPAEIHHEIWALENNTIVVNIMKRGTNPDIPVKQQGEGTLMADGTIVGAGNGG